MGCAPVRVHPDARECIELLFSAQEHFAESIGEPWTPPEGWEADTVSWGHVQLAIARRGRRVVALVPGTNQAADWTSGNLNLGRRRIAGVPGYWREGFALAGDHVWSRVAWEQRAGDEVLLVGHSFGAAAVVCAAGFAARSRHYTRVGGVLALAGPRCCSKEAAAYLDRALGARGQRFILGLDIVPWAVPPVGWRHAFDAVWIDPDGMTHSSRRPPFLRLVWRALRVRGLQALRDHSLAGYVRWARSLP